MNDSLKVSGDGLEGADESTVLDLLRRADDALADYGLGRFGSPIRSEIYEILRRADLSNDKTDVKESLTTRNGGALPSLGAAPCSTSDTPRTDPYEGHWATKWHNGVSLFEHARTLERENTQLAGILRELIAVAEPMDGIETLREACEKAKAALPENAKVRDAG